MCTFSYLYLDYYMIIVEYTSWYTFLKFRASLSTVLGGKLRHWLLDFFQAHSEESLELFSKLASPQDVSGLLCVREQLSNEKKPVVG